MLSLLLLSIVVGMQQRAAEHLSLKAILRRESYPFQRFQQSAMLRLHTQISKDGALVAPAFEKLLDSAWRTRGLGDFWSHMLVAEGAVDVAIEPSLALWDMAALDLIVREAGGRFTSLDGADGPFGPNAISTNGALHSAILEAIN